MIRHYPGHESQLGSSLRIARRCQQDQLGGTNMSQTRWNRESRTKFGHEAEIDKRHLELCALTRVHEVTMGQHCGSASDRRALYSSDQWFVEVHQRFHQDRLRTVSRSWRVLQKILDIVARAE